MTTKPNENRKGTSEIHPGVKRVNMQEHARVTSKPDLLYVCNDQFRVLFKKGMRFSCVSGGKYLLGYRFLHSVTILS